MPPSPSRLPSSVMTVSYTQPMRIRDRRDLWQGGQVEIGRERSKRRQHGEDGGHRPVSYTHLDVYKRQAETTLVDALSTQGSKLNASQGAVVSLAPDGAIRALIGGRDYTKSQFNRATAARRQPGSSFKPFVYLTAIEKGMTPDTIRDDAPVSIKGWEPENYSRNYRGPVTLATAMQHSLNTCLLYTSRCV